MFFNELDLLEIRLNELSRVVDLFILIEARKTHTGNKKRLYFNENKERFAEFPITHIVVDDFPEGLDSWGMEKNQRNAANEYIKSLNLTDDDVVLFGDVDEIFKADAIKKLANIEGWQCAGMSMFLFYYHLNCFFTNYAWQHARMIRGGSIDENSIRCGPVDIQFEDTGWHFSFIGDIQEKLSAYAHTEFDQPPFNTDEYIEERKENLQSLFDDKSEFVLIENFEYLPEYVKNNFDRFAKYIKTEQTL